MLIGLIYNFCAFQNTGKKYNFFLAMAYVKANVNISGGIEILSKKAAIM